MEQTDLKPITLTFKKTPEEIRLYKIITDGHTSKAAFVKDILLQVLLKGSTPMGIKKDIKEAIESSEIDDILEGLE